MRQHMFYRIWVIFQNKEENIEKWIKKNKGKSQDNAEKFNLYECRGLVRNLVTVGRGLKLDSDSIYHKF